MSPEVSSSEGPARSEVARDRTTYVGVLPKFHGYTKPLLVWLNEW